MPRVGFGYDVHTLVEGRELILCGVNIPFGKGLLGHSDADVATHALCDALLGAAALGDLGAHFPDSDAHYKNISSLLLLSEVKNLLKKKRFKIINVDITIIAEAPKIRPFVEEMQKKLAEVLEMEKEYVSVKGTTTEGLGFAGKGLGIAAQAVALIENE